MRYLTIHFYFLLACAAFTMRELEAQQIPNAQQQSVATSPETLVIPSLGSSPQLNMVREISPRVAMHQINSGILPSKEQASTVTKYYDGLGRPVQEVFYQASPTGKDLVQPHVYDALGREKYTLKLYPSSGTNGRIKTDVGQEYTSRLQTVYANESNFFTRLAYEASPLNRVLKSSAPGNSWSGSNRGQQVITRPNRADEDVKIFRYTWPAAPKPTHEGTFGAGQL
ncbi:DUF6443 domain-containing protein, partial [Nitritalea halalkaliphila]